MEPSLSRSDTCLIDMEIYDEDEDDMDLVIADLTKYERELARQRQIKMAIITLIFIISIIGITYSVYVDVKSQKGNYQYFDSYF